MDIFHAAERLMTMDDRTWDRHANPWSVATRFTCAPLLVLAIWSRDWIGWWALLAFAVAAFWTWYNPRAFSPPSTFDTWAGRGTRGERLYLNRANVAIPVHHAQAATALTVASGVAALVMVYGLIWLDPWATVAGTILSMAFKAWFVDRMAWLYDEMTAQGHQISPASPPP